MLSDAAIIGKEAEERRKGLFSLFLKSESAASTVVLALLLLGLIFTIISVIKLEYVPEWKKDAERNHMYDTWDDIVGVKTRIDILSRFMNSNSNYSTYGLSATIPFNMGGGKIPFLETSKSDGKLELNTQRCAMTVTPRSLTNSTNKTINLYTLECGGITYYSKNREYTDQAFRYENGALILANGESSIMRQPPVFTIEKNETNYNVTIQAVQLLGKLNSISSNTITPLQLTGDGTKLLYDSNDYKNTGTNINAFNLTIATEYPDAWIAYFDEIAQEKGLVNEKDYTVQYLPDSDSVCFSFLPYGNKTLDRLYVNKAIISTDIEAGKGFNYNYSEGWTGKVMKLNKWYYFDTFTETYNDMELSPSPDPSILKYYDPSKSPLPSGNSPGVELIPYSPEDELSKHLNKTDNVELTFKFKDYAYFDFSPSKVTVLMIYQYDNEVSNNKAPPKMEIWLKGKRLDTITQLPSDNWMLYSDTFSISPISPSDLVFTLKVDEGNNGQGTFYIDYLAVYLS